MSKSCVVLAGVVLIASHAGALAASCTQQSAQAFGSRMYGNEANTSLLARGYCTISRCEIQVEYSVEYMQTISMNGFPVTTAGAHKAVANFEVESGSFNERIEDETTIIPCTGRNIECKVLRATVRTVQCVSAE